MTLSLGGDVDRYETPAGAGLGLSVGNASLSTEDFFEIIYRKHFSKIYRFLCAHTRSTQDAEDLCNDVFLSVYKHLSRYDKERAKIETWIYVIAKNRLKNYYRDSKQADSLDDEENPIQVVADYDLEEAYFRQEQREAVAGLLRELNETDRSIIILSYLHQRSSQEIAEQLGMSAVNVRVRMSRALKKLQELANGEG